MPTDQALFPQVAENDWRRVAGPGGRRTVVMDDAIAIPPIAARRAGALPIAQSSGWGIVQRLTGDSPESIAREAAEAVAGGVTGIEIVFESSFHPVRSRLPLAAARRLSRALADLPGRDLIVRVDAGDDTDSVVQPLAETAGPTALVIAQDLIAAAAARWAGSSGVAGRIADVAASMKANGIRSFFHADGRVWHAGGATDAQELAAVLATVVALIRHAGLTPEQTLAAVSVTLTADVDAFLTVAKFRAGRLLLRRLAEVIEAPAIPSIHAETAWRSLSRREPRLNVLRATAAALAAATGGANTMTVLPYDAALGASGPDAARLARNTQSILAAEARLDAVTDPGAGSGLIETLTDALADAAWQRFQSIESAGGIIAAIFAGSLQKDIAVQRRARQSRIASGDAAVIGVNAHIDGDAGGPAPLEDGPDAVLAFTRLAEAFERPTQA